MADLSGVATIFDKTGVSFSQVLPANTRRVTIRADGLSAIAMQSSSGGTDFAIPLDEPYVIEDDNLGGRTLYFTTSSGEHVYILAEHDPTD